MESGATANFYCTAYTRKYYDGKIYERTTFPLALGYAVSTHKTQGATIDSTVVVNLRDCFAPGMMYVAVSRVTERRHIKFAGIAPKLTDFMPVRLPAAPAPGQAGARA
jgi:ATP-dependent DNA helicase PIF1